MRLEFRIIRRGCFHCTDLMVLFSECKNRGYMYARASHGHISHKNATVNNELQCNSKDVSHVCADARVNKATVSAVT